MEHRCGGVSRAAISWACVPQEALLDELPETVASILQDAMDAANEEVTRWSKLSLAMRILSLVTKPAEYSFKLPLKIAKG